MADVAVFCNYYPNLEVSFQVKDPDDVTAGDSVQISLELVSEMDDDIEMTDADSPTGKSSKLANLGKVSAPLFPGDVVGDMTTNTLLSVKRTNLREKQTIALEFLAPNDPGDDDLTLFCVSDSYRGCDKDFSIALSVAAAADEDSSAEESIKILRVDITSIYSCFL